MSQTRLAVGLCTGVLAIAFENMSVSTAMPAAAADLGRLDLYAWVFSLFVISMLFATVVGGRIADTRGPIAPLAVGGALFGAGLLVAGWAPRMEVLLAGRVLQGLGSGALNVCYAVVIAHVIDERDRPRMLSWFSTAWVVPSFAGPPIAAWLTQRFSWHWVFFSVVPVLVLAFVLGGPPLAAVRQKLSGDRAESNPVPYWAAIVTAVGVAAIQYASQRATTGIDPLGIGLLVVALGAVAVGGLRLMPVGFLNVRQQLTPTMIARALLGPFFAATSFFPLMMVTMRGWDLLQAGLLLTVGSVGWTAASWLQSQKRYGWRRDRILVAGTALLTLGIALMAVIAWRPSWWIGFAVLGCVIGGFGMGLGMPSTMLAVMRLSGPEAQGRNNAALQVSESLGSALLVGLAGTIYAGFAAQDPRAAFAWLFTAMAAFAALGIAAALSLGELSDRTRV